MRCLDHPGGFDDSLRATVGFERLLSTGSVAPVMSISARRAAVDDIAQEDDLRGTFLARDGIEKHREKVGPAMDVTDEPEAPRAHLPASRDVIGVARFPHFVK
jgi:hypothetical protein